MTKDRIGGLFILLLCGIYISQIAEIPEVPASTGLKASTLPWFISALLLALSISLLVRPGAAVFDATGRWGKLAATAALIAGFALAIEPAGLILASFLFLLLAFRLMGGRRAAVEVGIAATLSLAIGLLLEFALGVSVPLWPFEAR